MVLDETAADIPERDSEPRFHPHRNPQEPTALRDEGPRVKTARVKERAIEDAFLQLDKENRLLKEHLHRQDIQIKGLASKLLPAGSGTRRAQWDEGRTRSESVRDRGTEEVSRDGRHRARERRSAESAKLLHVQESGRNPYRREVSHGETGHRRCCTEKLRKGRDSIQTHPLQTKPPSTPQDSPCI
ncbi:uncharacterized protein LOC144490294 [Mustelus asterias]